VEEFKAACADEQEEKGGQKSFGHVDGMRRRFREGGFDTSSRAIKMSSF
jgi:hypothetical protein